MAQVHGNPAEMRRFAAALKQFTAELDTSVRRIDHASRAIGSTWNDQEYQKFMREWEQTLRSVKRFIDEAPQYEQYVSKKAQSLESYLRS